MPVKDRSKKPINQKDINIHKEPKISTVVTDEVRGTVTFSKGMTKSLGDFSSARITVSMTLPIYHTEEDVEAARKSMRKCVQLVDEEFDAQVEEVLETMDRM